MFAAADGEGAWWREQVTDYPEAPSLPLVPEQKMKDPHQTVRLDVILGADQKARLYDRAHAHGVTPAMVLATVFADTLARWSQPTAILAESAAVRP